MSAPTDVLLDHEVDGIREYDNPLPSWWLGIFYLSIAFAIVYIPYLYVTAWSQVDQYEQELAAAEALYGAPEEPDPGAAVAAAALSGEVDAGKAIYDTKCFTCHAADGTGGIGPNLTDAEWIHGGTLADIQRTVTHGVIEKGMLAWESQIGAQGVADVSLYIHGLGGGK